MQTSYLPLILIGSVALLAALTALVTGLNSGVAATDQALKNSVHWRSLRQWRMLVSGLAIALVGMAASLPLLKNAENSKQLKREKAAILAKYDKSKVWTAPDPALASREPEAELIAYGRDLIAHTADYFGANGSVRPNSINHLNCQNCHLDAGSKPFGNNYSAVASTYPKLRARSGAWETIPKRVNDCFVRSLNGQAIDSTSREMKAIVAYIQWLGLGVPKGETPKGSGIPNLPYLARAADPEKGRAVFDAKCSSCHGADGQGMALGATVYPPLWGPNSFNQAAGLFRISRLAGYVKANMPFGAGFDNPQLSDEEAWDVAAFIEAQPRPEHPFLAQDWPDISKKPIDHPFGPYKDSFPETQHKFGPFEPIAAFYKKK